MGNTSRSCPAPCVKVRVRKEASAPGSLSRGQVVASAGCLHRAPRDAQPMTEQPSRAAGRDGDAAAATTKSAVLVRSSGRSFVFFVAHDLSNLLRRTPPRNARYLTMAKLFPLWLRDTSNALFMLTATTLQPLPLLLWGVVHNAALPQDGVPAFLE
mmetsp:Transcript_32441/g.87097  ORF Transcript_32441/g.87097 Transcript_32441/m.87097 type:complete len:156 (+) Transcript_32441:1152-1619(+)